MNSVSVSRITLLRKTFEVRFVVYVLTVIIIVGMKFARLEQNILVALFLATFEEFGLCDKNGAPVSEPPAIDLESYSSWKPEQQIHLKLKRFEKQRKAWMLA